MRLHIDRGVYSTQAKGVLFGLHIGDTTFLLTTRSRRAGWLVEVFTHFQRFRVRRTGAA